MGNNNTYVNNHMNTYIGNNNTSANNRNSNTPGSYTLSAPKNLYQPLSNTKIQSNTQIN
jgi:hypothetical protein